MKKVKLLKIIQLVEAYRVNVPIKQKIQTCKMLRVEIENAKVEARRKSQILSGLPNVRTN